MMILITKHLLVKMFGEEKSPIDSEFSGFLEHVFVSPQECEGWAQPAVILASALAPRHSAVPGYQYN